MNSSKLTRSVFLVGLALLAVAALASAESNPAVSVKARYPYDPACGWGRIANGKGMLVRCLSEQEAVGLVKGAPTPIPAKAEAGSSGESEAAPVEPEQKKAIDQTKPLKVEVGPIHADQGKLDIGRLHVPKDRYADCVAKHGGLEGDSGEVHVRFLVRGDRSRAEGVSVSKRRNLSREAAKCVADVVDRRRVGTPDAPMVGATLIISFAR
jgi:hypothetical protein